MKKYNTVKHCFLFILSLFIAFMLNMGTAFASEDIAPPLPDSGLSELPDYEAEDTSYDRARAILPSYYDSRTSGYITSVRNQEPFGTCWAFGALAAGEASMIKKGIADTGIDLSELHLAYFFYHPQTDPLGYTKGDTLFNYTSQNYMDSGGNNLFTMFALSKWTGAAAEATVPYSTTFVSSLNSSLAYNDKAHLQNVRFVNTKDRTSVKNLIIQYGAVSTAMYYDANYFNSATNAYITTVSNYGNNHIVTLVGWNDDYPKENFNSTTQPASNGAWIVKNSYGTDYGDSGYIYISYEDAVLGYSVSDSLSYAFDMESADNYDHNYQYDGSFGAMGIKLNSGGSISNVYKVKGNSGGNERLEAVSFSLFTQNVNYSIQIYKDPDNDEPTSGTPIFTTPQTGSTTYSGYYTIPLETMPVFAQGDKFSVVITFTSSNSSIIEAFIDYTTKISNIQFYSAASNNQSYVKLKSSASWKDLNKEVTSATARIKAFTTNTSDPVTNPDIITSTLKKPAIKSLSNSNYKKIKLTWKKVKNAKGYQIFRSTSKNGTYRSIASTSKLSYTDTKRTCGETYYYKIRAYRTLNGGKAYSKYSKIKSIKAKPSKVTIKSVTSAGNKKYKLSWKKVSGATGYEIYRSTSKKKGFKLVKNIKKGSTVSYTNKVPQKKTYYYKIRAYRKVKGKKIYGNYSSVKKGS